MATRREPGHALSSSLQFTRGWEDEAYFLNEVSSVRVGTDMTHLDAEENDYYEQSDAYDYFKAYPNVRLTYHFDGRNSLAAYYNNRVDRPGEAELRIFPKYDDPEILKVGNPYLRPQFTETFGLSFEHLWNSGSVIASAYLRDIDDPFVRVFAIDPTSTDYDIVNRIYQNVGTGDQTGVELIVSQDVGDRWELTGSINWYDNTIDADQVTLLFPIQRPFDVQRSKDNTWDFFAQQFGPCAKPETARAGSVSPRHEELPRFLQASERIATVPDGI